MTHTLKTMILAGALAVATVPAHAAMHFRGGIFVGPVYRPWGYWGYPGPYYGSLYNPHPHSGQLKFDTKEKNAQVYLDGAFAGTVKEVNSAWLREGNHTLEVRGIEGMVFDQDIHVLAGKTLHIRPELHLPANS